MAERASWEEDNPNHPLVSLKLIPLIIVKSLIDLGENILILDRSYDKGPTKDQVEDNLRHL